MTETTIITLIPTIITAIVALLSGVVTLYTRRDSNQMKVRLAEIDASREETRGDAATTSGAITLATAVVATFEPIRLTLENVAKITSQSVEAVAVLVQQANEMHQVVERRDKETQQDRETATTRYGDIVARLDKYQDQLDNIAKEVTINTDENTLRHQFSIALLLIKEIGTDTKKLIARDQDQKSEPGESQTPSANAAPEVSEMTREKESK